MTILGVCVVLGLITHQSTYVHVVSSFHRKSHTIFISVYTESAVLKCSSSNCVLMYTFTTAIIFIGLLALPNFPHEPNAIQRCNTFGGKSHNTLPTSVFTSMPNDRAELGKALVLATADIHVPILLLESFQVTHSFLKASIHSSFG